MVLSKREQRLKFLGLSERDMTLLQALRPLFERHTSGIVERMCEHLEGFPETAELLQSRANIPHLKEMLFQYLLRISEGNFDDNYFADRQRLGHTHERIGLQPRWFLLSYHHLLRLLTPLIRERHHDDLAQADDTISALGKIFLLDASLAVDAYIASDRYRRMQELEGIINDSADAIFTMDVEKRIRSWNRAAEEIFGWRADEIIGLPIESIIPLDRIEAGEPNQIDIQIAPQGHLRYETVRLAKDGHRVSVELSVSLLRNPQGEQIGRCAILRDITERQRHEEAKLQSERLAVIGAMSAKLAHEIRNPLSSVILNLDLVRDEVETLTQKQSIAGDELRALLTAIDSEVRRIQRVTEDYLQFARMPKPRRDLLSLNELLTQGISFLQSTFDNARITIHRHLDPALPAVHGDEAQLWQAILNLIRNAIEAMPTGGTLTLATRHETAIVHLEITDTGKGIDPTILDNLFKPFYSTKPSGTGLGLPLTQQIITEHGGRIHCEPGPDRGTTFHIQLPTP